MYNDNTIRYYYAGDGRLSEIAYTGRGDTAGDRTVEFGYEDRPDVRRKYLAGSYRRHSQRLSTITTKVDDVVVQHYDLAYQTNTTGPSLLHSVTQCIGEGVSRCLPSTIFEHGADDRHCGQQHCPNGLTAQTNLFWCAVSRSRLRR